MVGHIPLEDGIGVRVPDPQQKVRSSFLLRVAGTGCLRQGLEDLELIAASLRSGRRSEM